jgi:hypothetical protein
MMGFRWQQLLVSALLTLTTGCGGLSALGSARTIDKGQVRVSGAIQFAGTPSARSDINVNTGMTELGVAVGLGKRVDWGVRLFGVPALNEWLWGLDTQVKIQLYRPKNLNRGVDFSLAPRVGFQQLGRGGATWQVASSHLAMLLGVNFNGGNQLVFGPQVGVFAAFTPSAENVVSYQVGSSVGFSWKVASCIRLMPNVTFLYSGLELEGKSRPWFYQATLTFTYGH